MRLVLINPNTSATTTEAMLTIARAEAGQRAVVEGRTAPFGAPLILDDDMLRTAAEAVVSLGAALPPDSANGIIVGAFGDPGLLRLREIVGIPVTGIAEAGMAEAGRDGRPFAVVTTTPGLAGAIERTAGDYGHAATFRGVWLTEGDPREVMSDPARLVEALRRTCEDAIARGGVAAIVIGGGPLASAAKALRARVRVPLIEPLPAAVRLTLARACSLIGRN